MKKEYRGVLERSRYVRVPGLDNTTCQMPVGYQEIPDLPPQRIRERTGQRPVADDLWRERT